MHSTSPEETVLIGKNFAAGLKESDVVGLYGDLGSGKTQFVKGICEYFNVRDVVSSPTFVILNEYSGHQKSGNKINILHYDLYRIKSLIELKEIGIENSGRENSVCLIEWAEIAGDLLSGSLLKVNFKHGEKENERIIEFAFN